MLLLWGNLKLILFNENICAIILLLLLSYYCITKHVCYVKNLANKCPVLLLNIYIYFAERWSTSFSNSKINHVILWINNNRTISSCIFTKNSMVGLPLLLLIYQVDHNTHQIHSTSMCYTLPLKICKPVIK